MQLNRLPPLTTAGKAALTGLIAAALAWTWIALTVHYTYQGHWTAMFTTGSSFHAPPEALKGENIYLFPGAGYDGQMYHYIAHDPFNRRGFQRSMDDPRMRYRRILVPLAAWTLALGQDAWIDAAYFGVVLGLVTLGVYWMAMLASAHGRPPAFGFLFLFSPAAVISIDRMTVDIAAAAFTLATLYYFDTQRPVRLWLSIAAACLSRETAAIGPVALMAYSLWRDRSCRQPIFMASALLPAGLWTLFAASGTPASAAEAGTFIPFRYFAGRILDPFDYSLPPLWQLIARTGDYLCLAGLALSVWYAVTRWRTLGASPAGWALLAWIGFFAFVGHAPMWNEPYNYGRIFTPLLLLAAADGFGRMDRLALVPLLLFVPRLLLQLAPQISTVARGLLQIQG
ncbi:MAG: hypothetical protein C0504_09405 [Candidatus Solibacter sp.]|nr:hypothetical protein [Candidatus Solibacter sp.]